MPEPTLINPAGAFRSVSDFTTWVDGNGNDIEYWRQIASLRCDVAIAKGDALMYVVPTTTVPLSVAPLAVTDTLAVGQKFLGVAIEAAAVGEQCLFATEGFALVNVGSATAAAGSTANRAGSAAGALNVLTAAATDIIGTGYGVYLGAKNASNLAPVWLNRY